MVERGVPCDEAAKLFFRLFSDCNRKEKPLYNIYIYLMTTWFLAVHIISYPFMQNESGQKKFCTEADVSEQEVLALGLKTLRET